MKIGLVFDKAFCYNVLVGNFVPTEICIIIPAVSNGTARSPKGGAQYA